MSSICSSYNSSNSSLDSSFGNNIVVVPTTLVILVPIVIISIVTPDQMRKTLLFLEFDPLPTFFEVSSSLHPISLTKSNKCNRN